MDFGDLIVQVADEPVAHPNVLLSALRDAPKDGKLKLVYVRDGARH